MKVVESALLVLGMVWVAFNSNQSVSQSFTKVGIELLEQLKAF